MSLIRASTGKEWLFLCRARMLEKQSRYSILTWETRLFLLSISSFLIPLLLNHSLYQRYTLHMYCLLDRNTIYYHRFSFIEVEASFTVNHGIVWIVLIKNKTNTVFILFYKLQTALLILFYY